MIKDEFHQIFTSSDEPNVYQFTVNFAARGTYVPPPPPPKPEVAPVETLKITSDSPIRVNQPIAIVDYSGDSGIETSRPEPTINGL